MPYQCEIIRGEIIFIDPSGKLFPMKFKCNEKNSSKKMDLAKQEVKRINNLYDQWDHIKEKIRIKKIKAKGK